MLPWGELYCLTSPWPTRSDVSSSRCRSSSRRARRSSWRARGRRALKAGRSATKCFRSSRTGTCNDTKARNARRARRIGASVLLGTRNSDPGASPGLAPPGHCDGSFASATHSNNLLREAHMHKRVTRAVAHESAQNSGPGARHRQQAQPVTEKRMRPTPLRADAIGVGSKQASRLWECASRLACRQGRRPKEDTDNYPRMNTARASRRPRCKAELAGGVGAACEPPATEHGKGDASRHRQSWPRHARWAMRNIEMGHWRKPTSTRGPAKGR